MKVNQAKLWLLGAYITWEAPHPMFLQLCHSKVMREKFYQPLEPHLPSLWNGCPHSGSLGNIVNRPVVCLPFPALWNLGVDSWARGQDRGFESWSAMDNLCVLGEDYCPLWVFLQGRWEQNRGCLMQFVPQLPYPCPHIKSIYYQQNLSLLLLTLITWLR